MIPTLITADHVKHAALEVKVHGVPRWVNSIAKQA